jgi:hypothetical protein
LESIDYDRWRLLSPYHALGKVQASIFGLDTTPGSVAPSVLLLIAVTIVGAWLVRRKILALLSI